MKTFEFGELVELRKEKYNPLTNNTVPCIELEHINQNSGTINGYVNSIEQKSIKNVFHKGDILFAKLRPYLRKYWFAEFDGVCSSEIWVLKPKSVVTAEYLFCLIQTEEFIRIANVSFGSKMPRADWDFINHYPFTIIHSLPEQQRIVSVLSLWDTAIAKQTALIEKLNLRKRGLMQQLLTGKKRLKGFEGEWHYHRIKDHFELILDKNDGKNHTPMTISAKHGLISQKNKFDRIVAGNSLDKYTLLKKGDFAYNKGNSNLYEMGCIYRLEESSAVVPFVYICFRTSDNTCCEFYQHFFINHGLDKQLKKIITSGARGDGLLNVNDKDFMMLKIPYPQIAEQRAIASILDNADKEIEIQKQKLAAMQEQKKGLMQQLLTGKKRIK